MASYAYLFPGQGAQFKGMIEDLSRDGAVTSALDAISAAAGEDIRGLIWNTEKEELSRSDRSQLAIASVSIALVEALRAKGVTPSAVMGFSLGEFPALYASGVLSLDTVIKVVRERGKIMQAVCDKIREDSGGTPPGMMAVLGLPPDKVEDAISGIKDVFPSNMNSVKQTVISGTHEGLEAAKSALMAAGARRTVSLQVAGPYHCPLMQEASDKFSEFLKDVAFFDPKIALFSNVTGDLVTSGAEAKVNAVRHLTNRVLWTSEEAALFSKIKEDGGEWKILEVGPGKVLQGLWRDSEGGVGNPVALCGKGEELLSIVEGVK